LTMRIERRIGDDCRQSVVLEPDANRIGLTV
jgi:hypothetical protein